jgi:carbonic anhydrase
MKKFLAVFFLILISSCAQDWTYSGSSGPEHWGNLNEKYKFCKIGYNQSPIDVKYEFKEDDDLSFFYGNSDVEKEQKNYATQVNFDDKILVMRGKKKYFVQRLDFHHPSEHLVDGKAHSLEMQITHKSEDEQLLILSIFLETGKEDPDFNPLINFLGSKAKITQVNLDKIINTNDKTFFYEGSLTTPPCTEGVKWYVMRSPLKISKEQMNKIIKSGISVKSNARSVQAFHPEKY